MSGLKSRLTRLREQSGVQAPADTAPVSATLAQRLRRARPGGAASARPYADDAELADVLRAQVVAPGLLAMDHHIPLATHHGRVALATLLDGLPYQLTACGRLDPHALVFLDTETTGLAGGTGTLVFLLGLARIRALDVHLRQYLLTRFSGEAAMLAEAAAWLAEGDALVTYNGKSFDIPLLTTRYRLVGARDPFTGRVHLDLLYAVRRAYASLWPECSLKTAERRLLDFTRLDDLPGHEVPAVWFEWLRRGEARRLPAVAEHNAYDLLSLAALAPALAGVYAQPGEFQADIVGVARTHLQRGDAEAALRLLSEHGERIGDDGRRELARLLRRRGDAAAAARLWQDLGAKGCTASLENLAKYYEHVRRDFHRALALTQQLIEQVGALPAHCQRHRRLVKKLKSSA